MTSALILIALPHPPAQGVEKCASLCCWLRTMLNSARCLQLEALHTHLYQNLPQASTLSTLDVQDKAGCLQLMAALFRAVVENKLDQLMMTFGGALQNGPPTQLPETLGLLRGLLYGPHAHQHHDLVLELCLTLPARYLHFLTPIFSVCPCGSIPCSGIRPTCSLWPP